MPEIIKDNSLIILLAIGTAYSFAMLMRSREKLRIKWWSALILGIMHTVLGVLSVKVFAVLETFDFSKAGSMSLFGGVFFMPLLYFAGAKLFRRNVAQVYDSFTPCMIFTVMCARVNCIISGCCLGKVIPGTEIRYPTREAEIVFYIALLVYIAIKANDKKTPGLLYPMYLSAYGAFRFICEFFRESDSGSLLHISHLWAIVSILAGVSFYAEVKSRSEKSENKKGKQSAK